MVIRDMLLLLVLLFIALPQLTTAVAAATGDDVAADVARLSSS